MHSAGRGGGVTKENLHQQTDQPALGRKELEVGCLKKYKGKGGYKEQNGNNISIYDSKGNRPSKKSW